MVSKSMGLYKKIKTILKILLLMFLTSCHPSGKEVQGKYCARHGKGIDCIEMRENGTFIQYFKNDTIEKTNEGVWTFETSLNQEKLILRNFMHFVVENDVKEEFSIKGKIGSVSTYWSKEVIGLGEGSKYDYYHDTEKK